MITNLLDADEIEFEKMMEEDYKAQQFMMDYPRIASVFAFFQMLWCYVLFYTICRRGHNCDIEMDGWAGPDSGGEDWQCRRCGRGGRVIYY